MQRIVASLRLVLVLVMALSVLGFSASTVKADQPYSGDYEFSETVVASWCSFPVILQASYTFKDTVYFKEGGVTKELTHVWEQDVFIANGKTLVTEPYRYNLYWEFDADGNVIHEYATGANFTIQLPDGTKTFSAGRIDGMDHPDQIPFISVEHGRQANVEGFCAALAP